jgi:hypothetical protein
MNSILGKLSGGRRLVFTLGLMALVHLGLLRFGNEDATPLRLLGSYVITSALLIAAYRIRATLLPDGAAPSPSASTSASRKQP